MPDPVGTHQLVLFEILKRTEGPVLELGAGDYSTLQIHERAKGEILTIETDINWLNKYVYLSNPKHRFLLLDEKACNVWFSSDWGRYSLVLIDSSTWEMRKQAIACYKYIADYLIIHDADYGKTIMDFDFKFKSEYKCFDIDSPTVLLASNFNDVNFEIDGMIKL